MECALFRKDYDTLRLLDSTYQCDCNLSLWNVPCLERITTVTLLRVNVL